MSEKRLIIIEDMHKIITNLNSEFYTFLDNLSEFVILIFLDKNNEINKNTKFYKYFVKNKKNIDFKKLDNKEFFNFIEGYIVKRGYQISNLNLRYLISKLQYGLKNSNINLDDVKNEIDKIFALAKNKIIEKDNIDNIFVENIESNIFTFLGYLGEKNTQNALKEFRNLHILNESNQKILIMIIRQIRLLISYVSLKESKFTASEIMMEMKIKNYEYSKISMYAKNFKFSELIKYYKRLIEIDKLFKQSSVDENIVMDTLIMEITKK